MGAGRRHSGQRITTRIKVPTAGTLLNLTYDPTLQMRAAVKWIPWCGSAQYIPLYCKNYSAEVREGRLLELIAFPARGKNSVFWWFQWLCSFRCTEWHSLCLLLSNLRRNKDTEVERGEKKKNKLPNKRHGKLPKGEVASLFFTEAYNSATIRALRAFCHFFSVYMCIYWVD